MSGDPPPINLYELFPELSHDVDRRIQHAETRIKYWVVAGVLVNLVAIVIPVVTLVYYLGGIQSQITTALASIQSQSSELSRRGDDDVDRRLWEQSIETWAMNKGYVPPRVSNRVRNHQ